MRPLLQVAPSKTEVSPLQGLAKLGWVQFTRALLGSSRPDRRFERHDSSDGSERPEIASATTTNINISNDDIDIAMEREESYFEGGEPVRRSKDG
ncbi:putative leucine-rich repeat receptor-like kinase protein FLORAL ORGAN NUMBER1 [Iris pallida]|uniref:Leucine-rich repeat receptor-like kinase protein FLORAL ORGAN NUMBER1 n=1 Tax=Iris pallida TaxID=29817 RepID=A0AAX6HEM4_IRIPA|nr:putative leucine-rich repeat receptor-like kinase protein FLORAL ORGAN NUMBER1 [Iris pallida]KAJ6839212.1 putative leucine-rich repeat receptor-like kinase protein FLORAL ORGAN NUMBER1 [Iris pallida]